MDDKKMSDETQQSVSRRGFIKGVIAAGAVASSSAYLFRSTALLGQPSAPGAVERLITLNVNGQDRRVDVMPQETLAMTIRYKLGLTGTKIGCDRAECGACTVLCDGERTLSCLALAVHRGRGHCGSPAPDAYGLRSSRDSHVLSGVHRGGHYWRNRRHQRS